ncbi:MAG: hypothetical protein MJA28_08415 [Gammaproteobacteria bacterium]|nr:hypothetical protein [Gammaproteobacteria bacterium]
MAHLNEKEGSIVSHCPGCRGGRSTFEWKVDGREIGALERREEDRHLIVLSGFSQKQNSAYLFHAQSRRV